MDTRQAADDLRRSLGEILESCLTIALRLRSVLEESARRELVVKHEAAGGKREDYLI